MRLDSEKIKKISKLKKTSLRQLLSQAGVSRTAYYNLIRSPIVLPLSVHKLARTLGIQTNQLLSSTSMEEDRYRIRIYQTEKLLAQDSSLNRDNVWHTLIMLEQTPANRLKGALRRGFKK